MFLPSTRAQAAAAPEKPIPCLHEVPTVLRVVWRERKIPIARGSIRGFYPRGPGAEPIAFESLLERDVLAELLQFHETRQVVSQPVTLHYRLGDRIYQYTPDLLIEFANVPQMLVRRGFGRLSLIECKPKSKVCHNDVVLGRARAALEQITSAPLVVVTDSRLSVASWEVVHDE